MSTKKQLEANKENALQSTGPKTVEGKVVVSKNAIRHGIFTNDLIISTNHTSESKEEYNEVLDNLVLSFSPQNQMENLLVEKIAIDFWRLRRVVRFEAGCIKNHLENLYKDFYSSYLKKNNEAIDQEVSNIKENILWNSAYIDCLKKEEVSFDRPEWENIDIKSYITDDLYLIARSIDNLEQHEKDYLYSDEFELNSLKLLIKKYGYSNKKTISEKLIEIYVRMNERYEREINELEQEKLKNDNADLLNSMTGILPEEANMDKVLKYERSLQKSLFQNLFLLQKLQGC